MQPESNPPPLDRLVPIDDVSDKLANSGRFQRFLSADPLFKLWLKVGQGASLNPEVPDAPWRNRPLRRASEVGRAIDQLERLGLHAHPDPAKNWDALATLDFVLDRTDTDATVLDAGGEIYSPLVEWLFLYGYSDLTVLNLRFDEPFARGPIRYVGGDCTDTDYADDSVDVLTSLSVLEHGIDSEAFLAEADRLLGPDGSLVVSTDYWETPVDTAGIQPYGLPWDVYDEAGIREFLAVAADHGFVPAGDVSFETDEPVVDWQDRSYTFIHLALEREH